MTNNEMCTSFKFEFGKCVCYATKNKNECKCNGDEKRCDFYEDIREKAQSESNYSIKIAEPYKPEVIPDKNKIMECLNNIADEVRELPYCTVSYIFEQLNDIRVACGIDSGQEV